MSRFRVNVPPPKVVTPITPKVDTIPPKWKDMAIDKKIGLDPTRQGTNRPKTIADIQNDRLKAQLSQGTVPPKKTSEIAATVMEEACSKLAGEVLNLIHEPDETLAAKLIADVVTENLNEKLQEQRPNQSTIRAGVKTKSCGSGIASASVEWTVNETIQKVSDGTNQSSNGGVTTTGANQAATNPMNVVPTGNKFSTTCSSRTDCTAHMSNVEVIIKFNLVGSVEGLNRRSLPQVEFGSISSSASSLYNASFTDSNNRLMLTVMLMALMYFQFFNFRRR